MLRYILIALCLVHLAALVELAPEHTEVSSENSDVPKKYYKKEYHKEHYERKEKHKKYEGGEKRHSHEENGKKYYKEKPKKYDEEKKYKHDKHYEERQHREEKQRFVAESHNDFTTQAPTSLAGDINVNNNIQARIVNPDSELVPTNYVKKDFYKELKIIDLSNPPKPNDTVLMARYIVHNVDWAAMATMASHQGGKHGPFATVVSTSDGPIDKSSGVPFFYITPKDLATQDVEKDGRVSITVTLAQTEYCLRQTLDPEDPRCARVTLSGKMKRVKVGTSEEEFAKSAMFTRHPVMRTWPADHGFYLSKLKISQIVLLDRFGGPSYINVNDYLDGKQPQL